MFICFFIIINSIYSCWLPFIRKQNLKSCFLAKLNLNRVFLVIYSSNNDRFRTVYRGYHLFIFKYTEWINISDSFVDKWNFWQNGSNDLFQNHVHLKINIAPQYMTYLTGPSFLYCFLITSFILEALSSPFLHTLVHMLKAKTSQYIARAV